MKKILTLISISFLLFSCGDLKKFLAEESTGIEASEEFVQGSEDIPLLVGMNKTADETLGFDSSNGSIIFSSYSTKIDLIQIKNFYLKTLPQMGWSVIKNSENSASFKRENESLEIEFRKEDEKNIVQFFISSAV